MSAGSLAVHVMLALRLVTDLACECRKAQVIGSDYCVINNLSYAECKLLIFLLVTPL